MKIRWISTIVLIVMFFAVQSVGYGEDELSCQPDAVVMFGNGVWNDAEDADGTRCQDDKTENADCQREVAHRLPALLNKGCRATWAAFPDAEHKIITVGWFQDRSHP